MLPLLRWNTRSISSALRRLTAPLPDFCFASSAADLASAAWVVDSILLSTLVV